MDNEEFQRQVLYKLSEYDEKLNNIANQIQENKIIFKKVSEHLPKVNNGVKPTPKKSLLDVIGSLKPAIHIEVEEAIELAKVERAKELVRKMQELK